MAFHPLYKLYPTICQNIKSQSRPLFFWVTLMFNRVDEERLKLVGPDRTCAEWLMKNGATVRWKDFDKYVENYNLLPSEHERHYIEAVDATDSGIHYIGFPHFKDCKYIKEIKLINCKYVEDDALSMLKYVKDTLKELEIRKCKAVTDKGLLKLKALEKLEQLKMSQLPYVSDKKFVEKELKEALPNCNIDFQ